VTAVLVWRNEWLLHIAPLDRDHQEMVRLLNRLAEPAAEGADPCADLLGRIDALITHIHDHFDREETFLESIDYPEREDHGREHALQMASFTGLRKSVADSRAPALDQDDLHAIKMWFLDHVFGEDKHYAEFYHRKLAG